MPTYSYRCNACNNAFDIQQSFTDDALTLCPECGGDLRKLFSAVGIAFKGSGFYRNDHGAGAKSTSKSATSSSESSGSSESTPAATSAPSTPSTATTGSSGSTTSTSPTAA